MADTTNTRIRPIQILRRNSHNSLCGTCNVILCFRDVMTFIAIPIAIGLLLTREGEGLSAREVETETVSKVKSKGIGLYISLSLAKNRYRHYLFFMFSNSISNFGLVSIHHSNLFKNSGE